jgi:hypothetical protein
LLLFASFLLAGMMGLAIFRYKLVEQDLQSQSKRVDLQAAAFGSEYVFKQALFFTEYFFRGSRNVPGQANFPIDGNLFEFAPGSFQVSDSCSIAPFAGCRGDFSATVHLKISEADRLSNPGLPEKALFHISCEGACGFRCNLPGSATCDQIRADRFEPSRVTGKALAVHGGSLQSLDFSLMVEPGSIFEPGVIVGVNLAKPQSGPLLHSFHLNSYQPAIKTLGIFCGTDKPSYEIEFHKFLEDVGISLDCEGPTEPGFPSWVSKSLGDISYYLANYSIPERLKWENHCRGWHEPGFMRPPVYEGDHFSAAVGRWVDYLGATTPSTSDWLSVKNMAAFSVYDLNQDGKVDAADSALLEGMWGSNNPLGDFDGSGTVDGADLAMLLAFWGVQTEPTKISIDCHENRQRLQVYEESGFNAPVYSFEVMGGQLFVGGGFTSAGGKDADRVVSWNGSTWAKLGGGPIRDPSSSWADHRVTRALKSYNDGSGEALYAGGFDWMNHYSFQKWNGSEWSLVHPPTEAGNFSASVRAIGVYDGGLFPAGQGRLPPCGGSGQNCSIARWNASGWTEIVEHFADKINALEVFQGALYVGSDTDFYKPIGLSQFPPGPSYPDGHPRLARWDGSTWSADLVKGADITALKAMVEGVPMGLDEDVEVLYAAGGFTEIGGVTANNIARWDGSSWSALGAGISGGSIWALESYRGQLIAAGSFNSAGGVSVNRIARWDGENWHALGFGLNGTVYALKTFDDGSGPALYVGGDFTMAGGKESAYIAKWDGSKWHRFGYGISGAETLALKGHRSVALFENSIEVISAEFCDSDLPHKATIVSKGDIIISTPILPQGFLEMEDNAWSFEKLRVKAASVPRHLAFIAKQDLHLNLEKMPAIAFKTGASAPLDLSGTPISKLARGSANILGGLVIAQLAADKIMASDIALDAVPVLLSGPVAARQIRSHRLSNEAADSSGEWLCAKHGSRVVIDLGPKPRDPFREPRAPLLFGGFRSRIIQGLVGKID